MTLFSDNSIQIQSSTAELKKVQALKTGETPPTLVNTTIFPPPSARDVLYLGYCMNIERVFVVLVDGTVCVYRLDDELHTAVLEKRVKSSDIKDRLGRSLTQSITSVTLG